MTRLLSRWSRPTHRGQIHIAARPTHTSLAGSHILRAFPLVPSCVGRTRRVLGQTRYTPKLCAYWVVSQGSATIIDGFSTFPVLIVDNTISELLETHTASSMVCRGGRIAPSSGLSVMPRSCSSGRPMGNQWGILYRIDSLAPTVFGKVIFWL